MPVALKKLKHAEQALEFAAEINVLRKLNHPNIVHLYGVHISQDGYKFMVFEFMNQGNLVDLLRFKREEIDAAELLVIACHIVSGMRYLEENHIVHRDLALRNVLVTLNEERHYVAKVSDFGLSRLVDEGIYSIKTGAILPLKWTAPECLQYSQCDSKSDAWSFGITLWELYSYGMNPYSTMTNEETAKRVVENGYRMSAPNNCPPQIYDIMLDCWKANPLERPSFMKLAQRLTQLNNTYHEENSNGTAVYQPSATQTRFTYVGTDGNYSFPYKYVQ
jgi:serine/threonine protein kinase